jgi:branched-chain amino acid transport system permease protein
MEKLLGSRSALVGTTLAVVVAALMVSAGHKQALVIGVITGAGYGLVALGLVLIYKSSGVFNFAQGEFGTVAVYTLYGVHDLAGVPLVPAMLVGLAAAAAMALATEQLVIRPLFESPRVTLLVATAGVSLLAISLELWLGEARLRFIQPALGRLDRVSVFGI